MKNAKKESDFIPLHKDNVKHSVEVETKQINEEDLVTIEKQGTKIPKKDTKAKKTKRKTKRKTAKKKLKGKSYDPIIFKQKALKKQGIIILFH